MKKPVKAKMVKIILAKTSMELLQYTTGVACSNITLCNTVAKTWWQHLEIKLLIQKDSNPYHDIFGDKIGKLLQAAMAHTQLLDSTRSLCFMLSATQAKTRAKHKREMA